MNLDDLIYADYKSYCTDRCFLIERITNPGLKISIAYRKARYYKGKSKILSLLWRFRYHSVSRQYGYDVPSSVEIGPGLKIFHPNGIVINSKTRIGKNFTIAGGSKIGIKESGKSAVIGDNVTIGINCTVIGNVTIGDNSVIGAGSVVVKDIPEGAIVCGNPAIIIKMRG